MASWAISVQEVATFAGNVEPFKSARRQQPRRPHFEILLARPLMALEKLLVGECILFFFLAIPHRF
jgi:hypothetical protein